MNRTEHRLLAGILAAAIGFVPVRPAEAANTKSKTAQVPEKSPAAKAPFLGRVVVTPSPQQMAKLRRERRMTELKNSARGPVDRPRSYLDDPCVKIMTLPFCPIEQARVSDEHE